MKIKITEQNLDAIQQALDAVNGRSLAHTYGAQDVLRLAQCAEAQLAKLKIATRARSGARLNATSGDKLPNSYKGRVNRTVVTLTRGARDWFLTGACMIGAWPDASRPRVLTITRPLDPTRPDASRVQWTHKLGE